MSTKSRSRIGSLQVQGHFIAKMVGPLGLCCNSATNWLDEPISRVCRVNFGERTPPYRNSMRPKLKVLAQIASAEAQLRSAMGSTDLCDSRGSTNLHKESQATRVDWSINGQSETLIRKRYCERGDWNCIRICSISTRRSSISRLL